MLGSQVNISTKQQLWTIATFGLYEEEERDVAPWYERSLMVRWVVGSIFHGVDPLSYFSFQPVVHDWYNKGRVCVILSVGWCI